MTRPSLRAQTRVTRARLVRPAWGRALPRPASEESRVPLERRAQALLDREVTEGNEGKRLMEGKPLPEKPRTPPTTPQAAPSADPKVVRPELRPAPGFTRGENPAKA